MPVDSSSRPSWFLCPPGEWTAGFASVAVALLLSGSGCSQEAAPVAASTDIPRDLPTMEAAVLTVAESDWPFIVRTQGSLMADESSLIGANVAGSVETVHVDLGDVVTEGAPLVTLDRRDFELEVARAQAALQQSRAAVGLKPDDPMESLSVDNAPPVRQEKALWDEAVGRRERAMTLKAQNAITDELVEQAIAAEKAAEARYNAARNSVNEKIAQINVNANALALAKLQLEHAVIKAPFEGQVQFRHVAPGAFVQVGHQIVTLVRTNPLRFQGMIPERYAQRLKVGQTVRLRIESITEPVDVAVSRISPALDMSSRALVFEALVENPGNGMRTGLFAEAEVVLDPDSRAIVIPLSSLVEFAGVERVWKVVDGKAVEQQVQTGQRRPEGIEVVSGLSPGDVILSDGKSGREAWIAAVPAPPVHPPDS